MLTVCNQPITISDRLSAAGCQSAHLTIGPSCMHSVPGSLAIHQPALCLCLLQPKQPASVALIPGGWAEARYARTNKLLLSKRLGFVKLAMETGAALVPVLGMGEERVGGAGANMMAAALLLPAKAVPLHVSCLVV